MRTLTAPMEAHLAGTAHRRVWMVRLDLWDGTVLGFTANNRDVPFDLGDAAGLVTYQAGVLGTVSDVDLSTGFEPSNFEISGPFGEVVTLAGVAGGRFDNAEVHLFQCNPDRADWGEIPVLFGQITTTRPEGGEWFFEVQGEESKFAAVVGETITTQCIRDFGDALCGVEPATVVGTVIEVLDDLTVRFSFEDPHADDYFNFGKVNWTSGELAGTRPIEIYDFTSTGWVTLFSYLSDLPALGDTAEISRGCSKLRHHADASIPTCVTYANAARFDGFPDITGSDQLLRPTIPGEGTEDDS